MNVYEVFSKVFPVAISIIPMVEGLFKDDSSDDAGSKKKASAMSILDLILPRFGVSMTSDNRDIVAGAVDLGVSILNALGVFDSEYLTDDEKLMAEQLPTPKSSAIAKSKK